MKHRGDKVRSATRTKKRRTKSMESKTPWDTVIGMKPAGSRSQDKPEKRKGHGMEEEKYCHRRTTCKQGNHLANSPSMGHAASMEAAGNRPYGPSSNWKETSGEKIQYERKETYSNVMVVWKSPLL